MTSADPSSRLPDSNISLAELRQRLGDPHLAIADVRALPAYNGWRSGGAARGGHIPGAVAFPSVWLESVDAPEVERLLGSKGILASREVALYGDRAEDTLALRSRLAQLGQTGVRIYEGGWAEWAAEQEASGQRLPGATSRWNRGKDLSWEPLRAERVAEVAYDHLQGERFRHGTTFKRWRPDKPPEACRYDQLEETAPFLLAGIFGTD